MMDDVELTKLLVENGGSIASLRKYDAEATRPDVKDCNTPDHWVARHERLVRLTGTHPFNCEPELKMLEESGDVTPTSLHFVRNHGAVPNLTWDGHRIAVEDWTNVSATTSSSKRPRKSKTFTMKDICSMPKVTRAVLLVCAGNRRKEQNMRKKNDRIQLGRRRFVEYVVDGRAVARSVVQTRHQRTERRRARLF